LKYSIDTSALMDGWIRYWPPDVFPAVWQQIETLIETGDLAATEEVLVELEKKDDELHEWAKQRSGLFLPLEEAIQIAAAEILRDHEKLVDTRTNRSAADPFVIALAKVHGCAVVTGEHPTQTPNRPNIPDVCQALGIRWISMLELYRTEGWRFT
jgi:Domain of unknown function (DUF4411)